MKGPGKGKTNNPNGRPAGTENKSTKELKDLLLSILSGQAEHIEASLNRLRSESDSKYLDALTKLYPFIIARKTDIEIDTPVEISITPKEWVG